MNKDVKKSGPEIVMDTPEDRESAVVQLKYVDDCDDKKKKAPAKILSSESDDVNFKICRLPKGPEIISEDTDFPVRFEATEDDYDAKGKSSASAKILPGSYGPGAYSISPQQEKKLENTGVATMTCLPKGPEIISEDTDFPVRFEATEDDYDAKGKSSASAKISPGSYGPGAYSISPQQEKELENTGVATMTSLPKGPEIISEDTDFPVRFEATEDDYDAKGKSSASAKISPGSYGPGAYSISPQQEEALENTGVTPMDLGNVEDSDRGRTHAEESANENIEPKFAVEEATKDSWEHKIRSFWNIRRNRYISFFVLFILIIEAVTLGVVLGMRRKGNDSPDVSFIVYSSKGVNADAIAEDGRAQEILGNTLVEGLASAPKLSISVSKSSFVQVIEALSGTSFSDLTYELQLKTSNSGSSEIKKSVETMASSGELTKISDRLDTDNKYGFIFEAVSITAIYDIAITIEYECTKKIDLKNEEGVDDALKEYHEFLNKVANQGFTNIIITNIEVTSGQCKNYGSNSQKGTQASIIEYKLPVECIGMCPPQGIPPIDTINRRRRLVKLFDDPLPGLEQLIESFDKNTIIKVTRAQTDKNANRLIGCNEMSKCQSFTNLWIAVASFSPETYSGYSVDLSGNGAALVIGNEEYDEARVFQRNANYIEYSTWPQIGQILDLGDRTGYDVSISEDGDTIAVGAPRYNLTGLARVYSKTQINSTYYKWLQKGQDLLGDTDYDSFGICTELANNGNTILIGASQTGGYFQNITTGGFARVYDFQDNYWVARGDTLFGKSPNSAFGYSGAISEDGNHICISAYQKGQVFCYTWKNINSIWRWYEKGGTIISLSNVWFGVSIALSKQSGNTLVIGSPYEYKASNYPSMAPNAITASPTQQVSTLLQASSPGFVTDNAPGVESGPGTAHIYEFNGDEWSRSFTTLYGNYSGSKVDISNDGNSVAIGGDKSNSKVHVYRRTNDKWIKLGASLPGDQDTSVSLSADGNFLAVGLHYETSQNFETGLTTVYKWIP